MESEEDCVLTPEMEAEAIDHDDDLGRLVTASFVFDLPPFPFKMDTPTLQLSGGV